MLGRRNKGVCSCCKEKRNSKRKKEREREREDDCGRNDRKKNMFKQRLLNVYNDLWLHLSYCLVEFNGVINGPYVSRKRHLSWWKEFSGT